MRNEKISIDPVRNQKVTDFFGSKIAENSFFLTVSSTEPTQTNYRYPTLTLAIAFLFSDLLIVTQKFKLSSFLALYQVS